VAHKIRVQLAPEVLFQNVQKETEENWQAQVLENCLPLDRCVGRLPLYYRKLC